MFGCLTYFTNHRLPFWVLKTAYAVAI
jgi:hypothetical protein